MPVPFCHACPLLSCPVPSCPLLLPPVLSCPLLSHPTPSCSLPSPARLSAAPLTLLQASRTSDAKSFSEDTPSLSPREEGKDLRAQTPAATSLPASDTEEGAGMWGRVKAAGQGWRVPGPVQGSLYSRPLGGPSRRPSQRGGLGTAGHCDYQLWAGARPSGPPDSWSLSWCQQLG